MEYKILLANGDQLLEVFVTDVTGISSQDNVYTLYNAKREPIFSAPLNSVVYINSIS